MSFAADAAPKAAAKEAEPVTTKDPQIALDDLELLLEPMTAEEIAVCRALAVSDPALGPVFS